MLRLDDRRPTAIRPVTGSWRRLEQAEWPDIVSALVEAWNRDDPDAFTAWCDPAIEWRAGAVVPDARDVYHGHEGIRDFWALFREVWESISIGIEAVDARPGQFVAHVRFYGRARGGLELDGLFFHLWSLRAGKGRDFGAYPTVSAAFAAADEVPEREISA